MTADKKFSSKEFIKFGWNTTKKNFWFLFVMFLIPQLLSSLTSFTTSSIYARNEMFLSLFGFLITVVGWVILIELSYAQTVILLKFVDNKKPRLSDLYAHFDPLMLSRFFLISIFYGLAVLIGLLLFIVPGIYIAIRYCYAIFVFVDRKTSVAGSFAKSSEITAGIKWKLFGFGILLALIIFAGITAFGIGILVALPIVYLAQVYAYRKLSSHS